MFNIKTLVAVAALTVAGTASAFVQGPVASTSGGEMSFTVFSATAEASFIFDTGISLTDFRASALAGTNASPYTLSYNLSSNTEFQSFLSRVAASGATDVGFSFFGGDNSGNQAAQRTMISSVSNSGDATLVTNGNMVDSMNNINLNYLSTVNLRPSFQGAANANASGTFVKGAGGNAYFLQTLGTDFQSKFQPTNGAVDESIGVYDFVRSSTSSGGDAIESKLGDALLKKAANGDYVFSFSTPVAPVASVPEPESYALMVAGLLVVGAAAARRRAK